MSVEGLSWEARIETDQLEKDAAKLESVLSNIGKKQAEEQKKLLSSISAGFREVHQDGFQAFQGLTPEVQKQMRILQSFQTELLQVGRAQRLLDADFKRGTITQSQYDKASVGLLARTQQLNSNIQQYSNSIRANNAVMNAASGSIDQRKAKLAQLQMQFNSLSEAELKNARIGGQLAAQIRSLDKDISKYGNTLSATSKGSKLFNQVMLATAGIFSITQGTRLIGDIIRTRGEIEQLEVAFSTMLKSKSAANELMREIVEVATTTPFTLTEVAGATKQLLAYGFAQSEIKQELLAVGNIASGVGATFGEVAYAYGTLRSQGRAYMRDIRQFTTRGIPIMAELATVLDTNVENVQNLVEAGKVGFPEVQKAFQNLTGAGGQFFNLMEKQSQTVTGEIAKLQDRIQLMYNEIGKANDGIIKDAVSGLSFLVEHYKDVADIIATLIITYGAYRAALILTAATQTALGTSTIALGRYLVALRSIMQGLNATLVASPVGAFTAAITALGLAFYSLTQSINTAKSVQENYNEAVNTGAIAAGKELANIKDLVAVLKSEVASREQKESAIKSLRSITGEHLKGYSDEEIASGKAAKSIDGYAESVKKAATATAASDQYDKLKEQLISLETEGVDALSRWQRAGEDLRNVFDPSRGKNFTFGGYFKYLVSGDKQDQVILESYKKDIKEQMKSLSGLFDPNEKATGVSIVPEYDSEAAIKELLRNVSQYFDTLVSLVGNKGDAEKIKESLEEVLASLAPSDPQISKVKSQLQKINQVLEAYSLKADNKEMKDVAAERKRILDELNRLEDKAYKKSFDKRDQEIEDAERQFKEIREAAEKAGLGAGVLNRIDLLEETATGDITYRSKTEKLKEEYEKRKRLYQDYEQYVRDFGVAAAEKRYSDEVKTATGYFETIQDEYNKILSIKPENRSGVQQERLRVFKEMIDNEKREQELQYQELLKASQNYEQSRNRLVEKYTKERAKIVDKGDREYLAQFDKNFKESLENLNEQAFLDSSGYKKFFDNIQSMSRRAALDGVGVLRSELQRLAKLDPEKGGLSPEVVKQLNAQLDQTAHNVKMEIPQGLATIAGELSSIAGLIGDSNKGLSKMLNIMSSMIGNLGKMKAGVLDFKAAQAANDGQGDTLGMITSGLGIAGAAVGAVSAIVGIFKTASEKSVAMQKKQLDFQRQIFFGELAISELYRDRALASAEVAGSTLKSLIAQRQVLDQSLNSIDSDIDRITSKFGTGIEKGYLDIINQQRGLAGSQMEKLFEGLSGQLYKSGTRKVGGLLGIGKKEIDVYESLAGLSFDRIEKLSLEGKLTEQAESLFQQLVKLKEEGVEVEEQLKEIQDQLQEVFTGGLEWSGMADGIIAEFQGAGSQIEDILKNAILSGFKYRFLEESLNKLIDQFAQDAQSSDELTSSEIEAFTQGYTKLSEDAIKALKQLEESTGIDLSNQNGPKSQPAGIQGGIQRAITEETGAELAGLWRGMYDLTKIGNNVAFEHLSVANSQLTATLAIQTNTYNTVARLDLVIGELKGIYRNTKGGQTGHDTGWKD